MQKARSRMLAIHTDCSVPKHIFRCRRDGVSFCEYRIPIFFLVFPGRRGAGIQVAWGRGLYKHPSSRWSDGRSRAFPSAVCPVVCPAVCSAAFPSPAYQEFYLNSHKVHRTAPDGNPGRLQYDTTFSASGNFDAGRVQSRPKNGNLVPPKNLKGGAGLRARSVSPRLCLARAGTPVPLLFFLFSVFDLQCMQGRAMGWNLLKMSWTVFP